MITTLSGFATHSTRGTRMLRSLRTACSKVASSVRAGLRATPTPSANARMASGVTPRRRMPASVGMRGSSQPAHVPVVHEPQQLALAHHRVVEHEPRELGLLGRPLEPGLAHQPVVDVLVVLELERAERVRDPLDRVGQPVREVVERVDAPGVAAPVMRAWRIRSSSGSRMIMLGCAMSILARSTCAPSGNSPACMRRQQVEVLLDRPLAIDARRARRRHRAAAARISLLGLRVDVRLALLHQQLGDLVQLLEVVAGVVARRPTRSRATGCRA